MVRSIVFDPRKSIPEFGVDQKDLLIELEDRKSNDVPWKKGRSPLHVYFAGEDVQEIGLRAYRLFLNENPLAPKAFPSLQALESDIISMALNLLGGKADSSGVITSGGTESIILALKAMRHWAREVRPDVKVPVVLVCSTAHPAYEKAADLLGLEIERVATGSGFVADVRILEMHISDRTIGLVGSFPCLPFGTIDPIAKMASLATKFGIWLHVDACLGGFLAPFFKRIGVELPPFDLSIPGVRSISADIHKYGYAPKGISVLLFSASDDSVRPSFVFSNWPKGIYETRTLAGTRSGGVIAAAWTVMNFLGEAGYLKLARKILTTKEKLVIGLIDIEGFEFFGNQPLGVISYRHVELDIFLISERMSARGWYISQIADPEGFQQTITPVHAISAEEYISDIERCIATDIDRPVRKINRRVTTY